MYDKNQVKEQTSIKQFVEQHLERDVVNKAYICPFCKSGQNNDSALQINSDDKTVHCHVCGTHADIFKLCGQVKQLPNFKDQLDYVCSWAGIPKTSLPFNAEQPNKQAPNNLSINSNKTPYKANESVTEDFTQYYDECVKNIKEYGMYSYLKNRGIKQCIQEAFQIGYDPKQDRIIFPISKSSYTNRAIKNDDSIPKTKNPEGVKVELYGIDKLAPSQKTIFIVEGPVDYLSVFQTAHNVIGLLGTGNYKKLIDWIMSSEENQNKKYILMLDNDDPGREATKKLSEELTKKGIDFIIAEYPEDDPNDLLQANPEALQNITDEYEKAAPNKYSMQNILDQLGNIEERPSIFEAKTGYKKLDYKLFGGLHEGLYIIGAISSLGKTTYCLQMANQISANGNDVIFFSLEMSAEELAAKSVSCQTDISFPEEAKDVQHILNNRFYKKYTDREKYVIEQSRRICKENSKNLYIYEGKYNNQRITVQAIESIVKRHIQKTGNSPVVFVDYLQIIKPDDNYKSDKQAIDNNVEQLKDLSREYKIPVIAISSFNRDNYNNEVSMVAFKESGAIEYSSDVLLGLQYKGVKGAKKEEIQNIGNKASKNKELNIPNNVELVCLKNRNGYNFTLNYQYKNAFNHFIETDDE